MSTGLSRADYVMLRHLDAAWSRARREGLDPHLTIQSEERKFSLVRRYDPTDDGTYHWWLAAWRRRLWDERGFLVTLSGEELIAVRRALFHFHAIRGRLPESERDIGRYRTLQDLRSVVPTRIAERARRAEADALKAAAHAESTTLFVEGPWRVLILRGYVAARFWGLGTRWCTTSSVQLYEQYASRAPLLVLLTPRGKFQLHTQGGQFKDAEDRDVTLDAFEDAPAGFHAILKHHIGEL